MIWKQEGDSGFSIPTHSLSSASSDPKRRKTILGGNTNKLEAVVYIWEGHTSVTVPSCANTNFCWIDICRNIRERFKKRNCEKAVRLADWGVGPPFFTNSFGQGLDSHTLDIYLGTCNSEQKTNKIENQRINCEICCRSRHEHIRGFLHLQLEHWEGSKSKWKWKCES